jgi:hypothetical protein
MEEQSFSSADLERRRTASRRLGWLIGLIALLVYVAGLFIKR